MLCGSSRNGVTSSYISMITGTVHLPSLFLMFSMSFHQLQALQPCLSLLFSFVLLSSSSLNFSVNSSSMGSNTYLPTGQRHRNDNLLNPDHHPQIPRIRSLWPHGRRRNASPRLWPHLRPQLLSSQSVCHGWSPHGSLRQLGP